MYPVRKMKLGLSTLVLPVILVSCVSGPTTRTVDGQWDVSTNICSSDPKNADLGDMRSEIRKKQVGISWERIITMSHLEKTIFVLNTKITGRSNQGDITTYENSPANPAIETREIKNNREVNNSLKQAIEDFFEDDPTIDGKDAISACLFRGQ